MKNVWMARMKHYLAHPYTCGSWVRDLDGNVVFCAKLQEHPGNQHVADNGLRWFPDKSGVIHVVHPVKNMPGEAIAYRIRAELVCCDIYDEVQAGRRKHPDRGASSHTICYWGEAAARLAEEYDDHPEKYRSPERFYDD